MALPSAVDAFYTTVSAEPCCRREAVPLALDHVMHGSRFSTLLPTLITRSVPPISITYSFLCVYPKLPPQAICQASLASFRALNGRVDAIGLFSDNEMFDEIATVDALYIVLPYAYADVLGRQRSSRRIQRMKAVADAEVSIILFC